ncbi:MAG: hypothetical protein K2I42_07260 [Anaeroplasmataceae bacterium]|nr:hypothetical protein [Anaeroplasmataceae bacterium]
MKNIIQKILDENNHEILSIEGQNHEVFQFEQVALINLEEELFSILHPIAEDVLPEDVLVFRIVQSEDIAELILEEDEQIIEECFKVYEQLYKSRSTKTKK